MVYSITQDKLGFLWFGTQDGLNRFDGLDFKIFKTNNNNPQGIGSNSIFSLLEYVDGHIWVGTKNGIYIYNPINEQFSPFTISIRKNEIITDIIRDIKIDSHNNIWFCVENHGVFCYSTTKKLTFYPLQRVNIRKIAIDEAGDIWLATHGSELLLLNPKTKKIKTYKLDNTLQHKGENDINDLCFLNSTQLLIGTSYKGILLFNTVSKTFQPFINSNKLNNNLYVRSIYKTKNQTIWIGTESGLFIYDFKSQNVTHLYHSTNDIYSLTDNAVHSLFQDNEGTMWVGTFFGGVNYYSPYFSTFKKFYPVPGKNSIKGKSISEFCEDDKKNIWIGTEDAGLNIYNPVSNSFTSVPLPANNIHSLMYDNGNLWVGTFSDGLFVLDAKSHKIKSHYQSSHYHNSLIDNNIYSIFKDSSGKIWIGTMNGLQVYRKSSNDFMRIREDVIQSQVNDIIEDFRGVLWFATIGDGLYAFNELANEWTHFKNPFNKGGSASESIITLLQDSKNRLWLGSEGHGICMYIREKNSFSPPVTSLDGLPNDVIYKLVDDGRDIWGSTNKGVFRLNPDTKDISSYTHVHGLLGDQFNYKSGIRTSDGELYFGGVKGFISFSPIRLLQNEVTPPIIIRELNIREIPVNVSKNSLLKRSIIYSDMIKIPSESSNFSLEFVSLSFVSPYGNFFSYKLEGYDDRWSLPSTRNRVSYSDLPAGDYTFRLKGSNSDGYWNQSGTSLHIQILPPWYKTTLAYIIYALCIIFLIYYIVKREQLKTQKKHRYQLKEFEKNKELELYNSQINFFTNITHEIRTPLTLIKLPLDELIKKTTPKDNNWEDLNIIQKNVAHLHELVNELLDFKKISSKQISINFNKCDIISLINDIVENYSAIARIKKIHFKREFYFTSFMVDLDVALFTKVLNNLFSNSLKHANSIIEILFNQIGDNTVQITVRNDGTKIPLKLAEKIFEPFFKINPNIRGAGIGLTFTRSLLEQHNGKVYYDTSDIHYTSFVIELPIKQMNLSRSTWDEGEKIIIDEPSKADVEKLIKENNSNPTILLVEDNIEFIRFLARQLDAQFNILQANNGKEALEMIMDEPVDLIISDIMMPVMDGLSMCESLKGNVKTSHIPIILLTAKTNIQSKIEGLSIGADEYIEKPFSQEFLIARIFNLIDSRKKLRDIYRNSPELAYKTLTHTKIDEEFMTKLIEIIHKYLNDIDLNVDVIAEEMHLSRATLYRKISSMSELTPNEFIQLIRLKKGAELLKTNKYRINEVAYMVGFNSPNYFSKCFLKQFGVLPRNFSES
ncbi:hybrid sensor histidine kinase/response regulator transcription factor [Paludibacter sp.]